MTLPEELKVEILSYLDVCDLMDFVETVPKLDHLLYAPKLWINVNFQRVTWINAQLLDVLEKNASQVFKICLNNPNFLLTNGIPLHDVLCQMSNVKYLDVSMCNLMEDMRFFLNMPHLEHLVMDCTTILVMDSFINYLPHCKSIKTLSIKGDPFLSMREVSDVCSQLVHLRWLDTQGTCNFTPTEVTKIIEGCAQLHTFLLNSFYYSQLYRSWIELVNVKYPHITYHYTIYQQIRRFERYLAHEINI